MVGGGGGGVGRTHKTKPEVRLEAHFRIECCTLRLVKVKLNNQPNVQKKTASINAFVKLAKLLLLLC